MIKLTKIHILDSCSVDDRSDTKHCSDWDEILSTTPRLFNPNFAHFTFERSQPQLQSSVLDMWEKKGFEDDVTPGKQKLSEDPHLLKRCGFKLKRR